MQKASKKPRRAGQQNAPENRKETGCARAISAGSAAENCGVFRFPEVREKGGRGNGGRCGRIG
ncbi:MAG TPA: hypothetical protein DDX51_02720 [Clostridiales bacterium]|nr:hypothetical protein [Clostridiales bacterium]